MSTMAFIGSPNYLMSRSSGSFISTTPSLFSPATPSQACKIHSANCLVLWSRQENFQTACDVKFNVNQLYSLTKQKYWNKKITYNLKFLVNLRTSNVAHILDELLSFCETIYSLFHSNNNVVAIHDTKAFGLQDWLCSVRTTVRILTALHMASLVIEHVYTIFNVHILHPPSGMITSQLQESYNVWKIQIFSI